MNGRIGISDINIDFRKFELKAFCVLNSAQFFVSFRMKFSALPFVESRRMLRIVSCLPKKKITASKSLLLLVAFVVLLVLF